MHHIGEQHLKYNLNIWKNKGDFHILNNISENVNLVQLMETLRNFNRAISIVGCWIFESNYEKSLFMTRESFNLICSPSVGEEQVVDFETVVYDVKYMW